MKPTIDDIIHADIAQEAGELDKPFREAMQNIVMTDGMDQKYIAEVLNILIQMRSNKPAMCYKKYFEYYASVMVPIQQLKVAANKFYGDAY